MNSIATRIALFSALQIVVVWLIWYISVPNFEWHIVQQFIGHIGPAAFLVGLGVAAFLYRHAPRRLIAAEAWIAMIGGALYVLVDTFYMHPPFGVFDGAGHAEQEHVALMGLFFVLGASVLVVLRKMPARLPTSAHFAVAAALVAMVFLNHHQHTVSGTVGHQATIVLVVTGAFFRILDKIVEYAFVVIVAGFVFFSSQMGLAMYVDMSGTSAGAWVALWSMLGFASATGYLMMLPADPVAAE